MIPPIKLNVNEIALHAKSKRELYRLLQLEGSIYLPPLGQANHNYIADILSGKKKFIKTTNLKLIQVPHLKGLRVPDIIAFAKTKIEIEEYLLTFKDNDKVPDRSWICNIVNTLIPLDFKIYIKKWMNENNMIRMVKRREEIEVIPEFAKLFKESETVSRQSGRFSQLLRPSRKRKREDVEEENKERLIEGFESAQLEKDKAIEKLKEQITNFEKLKMKYLENEDKLQKLFDMGVIDNEGEYIPYKPDDEDEMK